MYYADAHIPGITTTHKEARGGRRETWSIYFHLWIQNYYHYPYLTPTAIEPTACVTSPHHYHLRRPRYPAAELSRPGVCPYLSDESFRRLPTWLPRGNWSLPSLLSLGLELFLIPPPEARREIPSISIPAGNGSSGIVTASTSLLVEPLACSSPCDPLSANRLSSQP